MTNKVAGFGINTACIKGIKSAYKAKERSKGCRMRGMTEYHEAEKDVEKEARKEASRTGAGVAEEQPSRRTRQAVSKRPRAFASQGEPSVRGES